MLNVQLCGILPMCLCILPLMAVVGHYSQAKFTIPDRVTLSFRTLGLSYMPSFPLLPAFSLLFCFVLTGALSGKNLCVFTCRTGVDR